MTRMVTMTTTTLADAKARFSEIVAAAESTHERTTVTKNGRPAAVIISVDDLEALEETLYWLAHPDAQQATDEADRGEFVAERELRGDLERLGLPVPEALG
jgi:antitoxin YefM